MVYAILIAAWAMLGLLFGVVSVVYCLCRHFKNQVKFYFRQIQDRKTK